MAAEEDETVTELSFQNGILTAEFGRSSKMRSIHEFFSQADFDRPSDPKRQRQAIRAMVERAFERSYTIDAGT